jgi:hypothetical protein
MRSAQTMVLGLQEKCEMTEIKMGCKGASKRAISEYLSTPAVITWESSFFFFMGY